MKKQPIDRNDLRNLSIAFGAMALVPLSVWLMQPGPFSGQSSGELLTVVRERRHDEITLAMTRRYEKTALEDPDIEVSPEVRWQQMRLSLEEDGASPQESVELVKRAQPLLEGWPCLTERGYLRGEPVWLLVGNVSGSAATVTWICPPSAQDLYQERSRRYNQGVRLLVLSAAQPYQILE